MIFSISEIEHSINPDLILTDGYNGFKEIKIVNSNTLSYTNHKGIKKSVKLPKKAKILRKPIPENIKLMQEYQEKLNNYQNKESKLRYKIDNCSSHYKVLHHKEKLKLVLKKIVELQKLVDNLKEN